MRSCDCKYTTEWKIIYPLGYVRVWYVLNVAYGRRPIAIYTENVEIFCQGAFFRKYIYIIIKTLNYITLYIQTNIIYLFAFCIEFLVNLRGRKIHFPRIFRNDSNTSRFYENIGNTYENLGKDEFENKSSEKINVNDKVELANNRCTHKYCRLFPNLHLILL